MKKIKVISFITIILYTLITLSNAYLIISGQNMNYELIGNLIFNLIIDIGFLLILIFGIKKMIDIRHDLSNPLLIFLTLKIIETFMFALEPFSLLFLYDDRKLITYIFITEIIPFILLIFAMNLTFLYSTSWSRKTKFNFLEWCIYICLGFALLGRFIGIAKFPQNLVSYKEFANTIFFILLSILLVLQKKRILKWQKEQILFLSDRTVFGLKRL